MSCELTPDLKRSHAYSTHAAGKRPNTKLLFERSFSFADCSRNCIKSIKHLHKADLKNNVLIVMLIAELPRAPKAPAGGASIAL